jgi:hypothetical protein
LEIEPIWNRVVGPIGRARLRVGKTGVDHGSRSRRAASPKGSAPAGSSKSGALRRRPVSPPAPAPGPPAAQPRAPASPARDRQPCHPTDECTPAGDH